MKFQLFRSEVIASNGKTVCYVVAPCIEMVVDVIKEHYEANDIRLTRIATGRVDDSLGSRRQLGLQSMLETAPAGFATYVPKIGWMGTTGRRRSLTLYQITELNGDRTFIAAPNAEFASVVWGLSLSSDLNERRPFSISEELDGISVEAKEGLPDFLKLGTTGIVTWDNERGWSII